MALATSPVTVVGGDWVRTKLSMGHRSNMSRAVQRIEGRQDETAAIWVTLQPCNG